jgi:hypothetical protein
VTVREHDSDGKSSAKLLLMPADGSRQETICAGIVAAWVAP